MATWHVQVELNGRLTDEQMEAVGETVQSAVFLETGFVELRFDVDAGDPGEAVTKARRRLGSNKTVEALRREGVLTGPHRLTVMDLLAHARTLSLVGVAEGAALMGITPSQFRSLRKTDPQFPTPVLKLASADIWESSDIAAYDKTRVRGLPGRPAKA